MHGLTFERTLPKALIQAEALPSLPSVAVEVLRLCEDDDSRLDDLARAVEHDPALVARMLKLANSARFGQGLVVTTMQRAAMVLGLETVKLMALSFSLVQSLPKQGAGRFDYAGYWHRSLIAAVAARALAERGAPERRDELFLSGLLALIGQLALAESLPELYADVVDASAPRWPTLELERSTLGFHSADVAGALLSSWGLPEEVVLPVAFAERADEAPPSQRLAAEICGLALRVAGCLCERDDARGFAELEGHMRRVLGAQARDVEAFLGDLAPALQEAAELLSIELADPRLHQEILSRARARLAQPAPGGSRASYLEEKSRELARAAYTDLATGLPNRAAFEHALRSEVRRRMGREPRCLGLLLVDVDLARALEDARAAALLAELGEALRGTTRKSDLAARIGPGTFAVILPETTPGLLRMVAGRVRHAAAACAARHADGAPAAGVGAGGACIASASHERDAERLLALCERLVARAKAQGGARVEIHPHTRLGASPPGDGAAE